MASVFLSYDRDDSARARLFARVLESAGHQVWWDLHVRSGAQFSKIIEEALKSANVVVVLWSANSIESAWVRDEAAAGRDTGRLVPVTIDGTEPPLGFRQFQTIDLSRWRGRGKGPAINALLDDIGSVGRSSDSRAPPSRPAPRPIIHDRKRRPIALAGTVVVAALAVTLFVWSPWSSSATVPTILVTAGRSDSASQALARDLAVQLGRVRTVQSGSVRLISSADKRSDRPQLVLEAASPKDAQSNDANLVLKNTTDGAIVWSQDFAQGSRDASDLMLQMALTTSRVLDCATDAFADNGKNLPLRNRTLFLTSCAQTAEGTNYDPKAVVEGLSKVVVQAPRFAPAWRRLLVAEASIIDDEGYGQNPQDVPGLAAELGKLRKDIADARRVQPHMPEATVAEMSLVPPSDLITRMRLVDEAFKADRQNPVVLMRRSIALQSVGRMFEAVGMAYTATESDPSSPAALASYVAALLYGGQIEVAEQQLKRAQRLWPGTRTLDELEGRYYLRFGDPKVGLQMASSQMIGPSLLHYMEARADPTKVDMLFAYYRDRLNREPANLPALAILMQAYAQFHREDELYEIMLHWPNQAEFDQLEDIWFRPALHEFRRNPRFMRLVARSPLLRYWRTTGNWPDFCKEPDLPYDCKKEADKLSVQAR
jgi:hypothetical protein